MKKGRAKKIVSKFMAVCMVISTICIGHTSELVSKAGQREDVVQLAASQVGYHEKASNDNLDDYTANSGYADYQKYARDLGVGNGQPWCAYFVWWVLQTAGVDGSTFPKSGWVPNMAQWYKNAGAYRSSGGDYIPNPGDIVFFSGYGHVGIVEYVDSGYVHCIEGNCSDQVKRTRYNLYNSTYMIGFGSMNYAPSDTTKPVITDAKIIERTATTYTIQCSVTDDVGIERVAFATWTEENERDDIVWHNGILTSDGVFLEKVDMSEHGNEQGVYITHIYAYDTSGNVSDCWQIENMIMDTTPPTVSSIQVKDITTEGFKLQIEADDDSTGVKYVACLAYTGRNSSEIPENWHENSKYYAVNNDGKWEYEFNVSDYNNIRGSYDVKVLVYDGCSNVCEYIVKDIVIPEPKEDEQPATVTDNDEISGGDNQNSEAGDNQSSENEDNQNSENGDNQSSEDVDNQSPENGDNQQPQNDNSQDVPDVKEDNEGDVVVVNVETNIAGDTTNNTISNYETVVNNYTSNNTYVQNGIPYTADNIPVLTSINATAGYINDEVQENVISSPYTQVADEINMTEEQYNELYNAFADYFISCYLSCMDDMDNSTCSLAELKPEQGKNFGVSLSTKIDGKNLKFTITLK